MTDDELRALEQRWRRTGAVEDEAAWLAASVRAGEVTPAALRLRAWSREPGALLALGRDPAPVEVPLPPSVDEALAALAAAGAVVDHALFEPPGEPDDAAAHELVARVMARRFGESEAESRRRGATRGERVSLAALLGDQASLERRALLFPSSEGLLPATEAMAARARDGSWGASLAPGYARALSDPPYGVRLPLDEVSRRFDVVWLALASWDDAALVAFSWSTDAWPAFEAGHEWWGSPLWTIAPRDGRPWAALAASSTD